MKSGMTGVREGLRARYLGDGRLVGRLGRGRASRWESWGGKMAVGWKDLVVERLGGRTQEWGGGRAGVWKGWGLEGLKPWG